VKSCLNMNGVPVDCTSNQVFSNATFMEPDLYKCQQLPLFCDDQHWKKLIYNVQKDASGMALPSAKQQAANPNFIVDSVWQKSVNKIANPLPSDLYYLKTPGCCRCEPHLLPYYFIDNSITDPGYPDNKRKNNTYNYYGTLIVLQYRWIHSAKCISCRKE
jgi:hypothetical protein